MPRGVAPASDENKAGPGQRPGFRPPGASTQHNRTRLSHAKRCLAVTRVFKRSSSCHEAWHQRRMKTRPGRGRDRAFGPREPRPNTTEHDFPTSHTMSRLRRDESSERWACGPFLRRTHVLLRKFSTRMEPPSAVGGHAGFSGQKKTDRAESEADHYSVNCSRSALLSPPG
jgi:hypothetical protein